MIKISYALSLILLIISFKQEDTSFKHSDMKSLKGFWRMSNGEPYGVLFTKGGYYFPYERVKGKRIATDIFAPDIHFTKEVYKFNLKNDSIKTNFFHDQIIGKVTKDSLILYDCYYKTNDTLIYAEDQNSPAFVKNPKMIVDSNYP
jgi:hypothetical protein